MRHHVSFLEATNLGNPQNFSLDVPRRCQKLLEALWPKVSKNPEGGTLPLNASFLLAISTPMVNLPFERIWKPQMNRAVGHLNDSVLDPRLADAIRRDISSIAVTKAGFYRPNTWRYYYLPTGTKLPDLSQHGLPQAVESALRDEAANQAAGELETQTFCEILRNGLAHGGVIYLDKDGRTTAGAPVRMFCFVSTRGRRRVEGLHFLRVSMKGYRTFLRHWTEWLESESTQVAAK